MIGRWIKEAAAAVGGQKALAELVDVSERSMSDYAGDKSSPQWAVLERIAAVTGASLSALTAGEAGLLLSSRDLVSVPRYDIQASAGHGAFADRQEAADHLIVSREWLGRYVRDAGRVVVIEARGDSMEPTVRHGDLLMVEMNVDGDHVSAGGVFVLTIAGMIMVKRLQIMLDGDLKISSDNRAYDPETVPAAERDDKVIVHGRVFWSGGPLASR